MGLEVVDPVPRPPEDRMPGGVGDRQGVHVGDSFVYHPCMVTKTITLEIDAYERLKAAKRTGESFSAVVRRAILPAEPPTGRALLEYIDGRHPRVSELYLASVEAAADADGPADEPWTRSRPGT